MICAGEGHKKITDHGAIRSLTLQLQIVHSICGVMIPIIEAVLIGILNDRTCKSSILLKKTETLLGKCTTGSVIICEDMKTPVYKCHDPSRFKMSSKILYNLYSRIFQISLSRALIGVPICHLKTTKIHFVNQITYVVIFWIVGKVWQICTQIEAVDELV